MKSELLKTKSDVFNFLFDQKYLFLYKAQEAEDLGNTEGAAVLRTIAEQIGVETKRIASEMRDGVIDSHMKEPFSLDEQIQNADKTLYKKNLLKDTKDLETER